MVTGIGCHEIRMSFRVKQMIAELRTGYLAAFAPGAVIAKAGRRCAACVAQAQMARLPRNSTGQRAGDERRGELAAAPMAFAPVPGIRAGFWY
jgi:hypothetical protein